MNFKVGDMHQMKKNESAGYLQEGDIIIITKVEYCSTRKCDAIFINCLTKDKYANRWSDFAFDYFFEKVA